MKHALIWMSVLVLVILSGMISCANRQKEITIGVILPLTGNAAKYGQATKNGIDLALEEINHRGGINGRSLKAIYEDSQADPKMAVSVFQKLTTIDKASFILGPLASSSVLAVAPIANRKKVIVLSPAASSPKITDAGDYIFRNVMSDLFDGRAIADFAFNSLKKRTAGVIYINNDFGVGLKKSFRAFFEKYGGEIKAIETFNQGDNDFRTQLTKIMNSEPEVVFLAGQREMGYVLRQARELGLQSQWISFSMFEDPEILKIAGNAANNVYYTYRAFDPKSDISLVRNFSKNYKQRFGQLPDIFAGLSYDAARIIVSAIERGGAKDTEKVKMALYNTRNFPGVVGETTFDENGDVIKPIGIKRVEKGKFIWVDKSFESKETEK